MRALQPAGSASDWRQLFALSFARFHVPLRLNIYPVAKRISIVIPTLNEAANIAAALARLQPLRARGHEVIVVDGGSTDDTERRARPHADQLIDAPRGRAAQMNAGAEHARGDVLLFLHADTVLPDDADRLILDGLRASNRGWGRFDLRIDGRHWLLPLIALGMNLRSRLTRVCTGDQCIFVSRDLFMRLGGYPPIELMEDIALTKRLRCDGPPLRLSPAVITSSRRWERHGVARTMLFMWWLRLRYFFGASPARLARLYDPEARAPHFR
jgi:rSAM/selenodomain-associated transferase 2